MTSHKILHQKRKFQNKYIIEMKVWAFDKNNKYPDGFSYTLIFIDPKSKFKILMDNHYPKGHHYHIGKDEFPYVFVNIEKLVSDFKGLILEHTGFKI